MQRDAVIVLLEPLDAATEPETLRTKPGKQDVQQIGPVRGVIRRTKALLRPLAERRVIETVAGIPGAVVAALRIIGDLRQRFAEAERAQDARGVAADLKPGADLAEGRRLLEQFGLDAALAQRQERGDSADAAACDENFVFLVGHCLFPQTARFADEPQLS